MSSFVQNTVLSGLLVLGAGLTGSFAQTKKEMKLIETLKAPDNVSVVITPPETPSTAPNRQTSIDYFMESLDEPGLIRMLHIDAVDGHNGKAPNDTISMYDIQSFKFTEISRRGKIEISGKNFKPGGDYEITSKDVSTSSDNNVEKFSVYSLLEVDAIYKLLNKHQP